MIKVTVHEGKVNEKTTKLCNSPQTTITVWRKDNIPLICTGAGPIQSVHSQPISSATGAIPRNEVTFLPFSRDSYTNNAKIDMNVLF